MSLQHGKEKKAGASFKIEPTMLQEAKDLAWKKRIAFSLQVENLVKEWIATSKKSNKPETL